jgi:hypothetical protein
MRGERRKLRFGLWYAFRNPAEWRTSYESLYAEVLEQIAWAGDDRLRRRLADRAPFRRRWACPVAARAGGGDCGSYEEDPDRHRRASSSALPSGPRR